MTTATAEPATAVDKTNLLSWEETDDSFKEFKGIIDKRFDYDLSAWMNIREYDGKAPSWWRDTRSAAFNSYCDHVFVRLVSSVTGEKAVYFNSLSALENQKMQEVFARLKDVIVFKGLGSGCLESRIRHECRIVAGMRKTGWTVSFKEVEVILEKDPHAFDAVKIRKPDFQKPGQPVDQGQPALPGLPEQSDAKLSSRRPNLSFQFKDTGDLVYSKVRKDASDETLVCFEVIPGFRVGSSKNLVLLTITGPHMGAWSETPSPLRMYTTEFKGHHGGMYMKYQPSPQPGTISAEANAILESGGCYLVKNKSASAIPTSDVLNVRQNPLPTMEEFENMPPLVTYKRPEVSPEALKAVAVMPAIPADEPAPDLDIDVTGAVAEQTPSQPATPAPVVRTTDFINLILDKQKQLATRFSKGEITFQEMVDDGAKLEKLVLLVDDFKDKKFKFQRNQVAQQELSKQLTEAKAKVERLENQVKSADEQSFTLAKDVLAVEKQLQGAGLAV